MSALKRSKVVSIWDACLQPRGYSVTAQGLTQSLLSAFLACPMRGMLALNRWGHESKLAKTRFGSLFHGLLEYAYSSDEPPTEKQAEAQLRKTVAELRAEYGGKAAQQAETDIGIALTIWKHYREFHAKDWKLQGRGQTETEFAFTAHGILWRGKRDGLLPDRNGGLWLYEHKTHSQIDDEWFTSHLSIDLQVLTYLLSLRYTHPGVKVLGVKYNVVRTPSIKQGMLSLAEYLKKLDAHIAADPAHYFHRYEVRVSGADVDQFSIELERMVDTAVCRYTTGVTPPYRNSCACRAPWPCEFLAACCSGNMNGYVQRKELNPELSCNRGGADGSGKKAIGTRAGKAG